MLGIGSQSLKARRLAFDLDLQAGFDSVSPHHWSVSLSDVCCVRCNLAYMSKGYTMAFAMTAPVAPATAAPHGGNGGNVALLAIGSSVCSTAGQVQGVRTWTRSSRISRFRCLVP